MRVVAGSARGRRLVAPRGDLVRPTTDRVKESVFNALTSLGLLDGAEVLDLFAGSGALGIEALSRGASAATFVEDDRRSLAAVRRNLDVTGLAVQATVVQAEVLAWLDAPGAAARHCDLALADPPYAFDRWPELLALLADRASFAVLESDREVPAGPPWDAIRVRAYGSTLVTFLRRC